MARLLYQHFRNHAFYAVVPQHFKLLLIALYKDKICPSQTVLVQPLVAPIFDQECIWPAVSVVSNSEDELTFVQLTKHGDQSELHPGTTYVVDIRVGIAQCVPRFCPTRMDE